MSRISCAVIGFALRGILRIDLVRGGSNLHLFVHFFRVLCVK